MQVKLKLNKNKGFTLIEIMVAISIMAIGLVGAYSVLPMIIKSQAVNANEFLASQIANEGMELVRNIRDNNWLLGNDWTDGLTICSSGCEILHNTPLSQISGSPKLLRLAPAAGFYNYNTGPKSIFKRKITIQEISGHLNVKVEVIWDGNGSPFVLEENFYDWQ